LSDVEGFGTLFPTAAWRPPKTGRRQLIGQENESSELGRSIYLKVSAVEGGDAPELLTFCHGYRRGIGQIIGRSLYFFIDALILDISRCSSGSGVTYSPLDRSQSASWAFHEKLKRYIASVSAGRCARKFTAGSFE
jgi:hypothetical protein